MQNAASPATSQALASCTGLTVSMSLAGLHVAKGDVNFRGATQGFHRIRHYGLFAGTAKAEHIATARKLLGMQAPDRSTDADSTGGADDDADTPCPCCGGRMRIIEVFERGQTPRRQPSPRPTAIRIDTS